MKKSLRFAVAAAAMGMAATASAGYFEIGAEIEDYNGNSSDESFYLPYMEIGGNPIEGSPLRLSAKMSYLQKDTTENDAPDLRDNRYRQEFTVGYAWDFGNYTFSPQYRLRQNFYAASRSYEHRIFPNMSYRLNDTFSVALDGFLAPVQRKRADARGTDTAENNDYVDYIHELDMQLNTRISDTQSLRVSVYNEYGRTTDLSKAEAANDDDKTRNANEWQLRLVYTQDFGDFSLTPFARIGLSSKEQKVAGDKLNTNRHRFGLAGSYKLTNDLSLVGETYFQTRKQNKGSHVAGYSDDHKQNYMFYQVGVRYSF